MNYYIFTDGEPIHIELNIKNNHARIDKKSIELNKLEASLTKFLNQLQRYKKSLPRKPLPPKEL